MSQRFARPSPQAKAEKIETVVVPFHGEGGGEGELTWAQRSIWMSMLAAGRSIAIGGAMALPAGTTVDDMARVLSFAMSRHQSLRTRLRFQEDGEPVQVVSQSGEAALSVVDVPDDGAPAATAEAIRARQELGTFDYAAEWPVWMTVVRHRGEATHLVLMYSHLAVDGQGIAALVEDLKSMDPLTGTTDAPVKGVQPLELARQEKTEASRRHSDIALRHWERVLRTVPPRRFPKSGEFSGDPREPRFWELECHSPALYLATQSVMRRTGVESGVVLLAAYATAMARLTGAGPSVAQIVVDNRFRPGFAGSVSHLAQCCPVAIDVDDRTFDEVTTRAWQASVMAAKYAYCDAVACHDLVAKVGVDRGEPVETACFVNDRRIRTRAASALTPTPEDLEEALPRTTRRWGRRFDWYDGIFFLHLDDGGADGAGSSDGAGDADGTDGAHDADSADSAIAYTVWADTRRLAPAGIEAFARHFEDVVVQAAFDPAMTAFAQSDQNRSTASRSSST